MEAYTVLNLHVRSASDQFHKWEILEGPHKIILFFGTTVSSKQKSDDHYYSASPIVEPGRHHATARGMQYPGYVYKHEPL